MWLLMVSYEARGIPLDATAPGHLTGEVVAHEHAQAKRLPFGKIVPLAPVLSLPALPVTRLLIAW